jgi:hypothetical protein
MSSQRGGVQNDYKQALMAKIWKNTHISSDEIYAISLKYSAQHPAQHPPDGPYEHDVSIISNKSNLFHRVGPVSWFGQILDQKSPDLSGHTFSGVFFRLK